MPCHKLHSLGLAAICAISVTTIRSQVASELSNTRAPVAGGKLYWTLNWPHKIQRSNLDGSEVEDVVANRVTYPHGIAVDAEHQKLYWSDSDTLTDKIQRSNLDGSSIEDVLVGYLSWGMAVDSAHGKLYWSDLDAGKILRSSLDGDDVEDVAEGLEGPGGIALDVPGGRIYWCDTIARKVQRAFLNGSHIEDVAVELSYPQALAVDTKHGKLYWTDSGTFKIQRANLDGSSLEDVVTEGLKDPRGITIDVVGGTLYWSSVGTQYDGQKGSSSQESSNGKIQRCALEGGCPVESLVSTSRAKVFSLALHVPQSSSSCAIDGTCSETFAQ